MDENLVGYLLNALDADTQRQVEAHLHTDPEAPRRLDLLRQALEPLAADAEVPEPTPGLWVRTLARVVEGSTPELPRAPATLPLRRAAAPRPRWRRPDVLVAAAVLVALFSLAPPALFRFKLSRDKLSCQNNLRQFHVALSNYCDFNDNNFPKVEATPPLHFAGSFVPQLNAAGVLGPDVSVTCSGSGGPRPLRLTRQQLDDLLRQDQEAFEQLVRETAGCYAYSLGFRDDQGNLHGLRREPGMDRLPILADRPPFVRLPSPSEWANSPNHGGTGQNVLHIGGNVMFCTQRGVGPDGDDIYLNQKHRVAAGLHPKDTVLGASAAQPGLPNE
jgi:hypothetical protein